MFAGRFVPVKLTTNGNPEWSRWSRKYPVDGGGIPILYVVRSDGEKLYAKFGALSGAALPQMLFAALQQSGRQFTDAETELLTSSVVAAQAAMQKESYGEAALELSKLSKLGAVGDLKSFAAPAIQADKLARQVVEASDKAIRAAVAGLESPATAFDSALALADAERQYAGFPELKRAVTIATRTAKQNPEVAPLFVQAETLLRARRLGESDKSTLRKQASEVYESVIRRFPGTAAERIARTELANIDPDAPVLSEQSEPPPPPATAVRTWTDATGNFKIRASLVKLDGDAAVLRTEAGKTLAVPIAKLSPSDQTFLRALRRP